MFRLIYKEMGKSSFQVIDEFKRKNNIQKIGHTGTLDPLAQGLLLIATDEDTKLIPYLTNKDKEYNVELKLGFNSATFDSEGPICFFSDYIPSEEEVNKVINSFVGKIKQIPPSFSSKKINGKRAYELARKNIKFNLKENEVEIYSINNIYYHYPIIKFKTKVSNGTYIRSLVNDIGKKLTTGAYMTFLERTMVNGIKEDSEINIKTMIQLPLIRITEQSELKRWFFGLNKSYIAKDEHYLLSFNDEIIGVIKIQNNKVIKTNLFGKKIQNFLT